MKTKLGRYIVPSVLATVGTSCYTLADTFFISLAEGANGITALNLVLPIYGLIFAIGAMIGIGSATCYSLKKSRGEADADAFFINSIVFTAVIGVILMTLGLVFARQILAVLGADDTIMAVGLDYLKTFLIFTPFFMLNYTFTAFIRNDGAPNIAMAATIISGVFNIVFDYVFMFPMGLGMFGAALATGVSPIVSMLICLIHYFSKKNNVRLVRVKPSFRRLFSACSLGVSAFVGEITMSVTTLVFNFLLLAIGGNTAVAAYGVIANLAVVAIALFNGVSQGLQPMASALHGQGDAAGEKSVLVKSAAVALVIAAVLLAVTLIFARQIVAIFNTEGSEQLFNYAVPGIKLYFTGFPLAAVNVVFAGFYAATGQGRASSLISVTRGIIAIILCAFIMSELLGITGVWLSFPAAEVITLVITLVLLRKTASVKGKETKNEEQVNNE